jgi:hypothetical protein
MPIPTDLPIRWSLHKAEIEFGRSVQRIKTGLRAAGISPGADGKYSTREIATALFGFGTLERRAREAKMQQQMMRHVWPGVSCYNMKERFSR